MPDELAHFAAFYDEHASFVHRAARRLGVGDDAVEDVVQEVFLVAHRRHDGFRGDASPKTWLYGIVINIVRLHRRTTVRSRLHGAIVPPGNAEAEAEAERVAGSLSERPDVRAETADAYRALLHILTALDEDKREVFVLAELEQLSIPEIASILDLKLNTAYSRLRLARTAFHEALALWKRTS